MYKIVNREGFEFSGIIGAVSAADYESDVIKKHEDTLEYREQIFKEYLKTVGFNAEPVLLTYPDNSTLEKIIKKTQSIRAEFEFTTTYRDTHYLWLVQDESLIEKIGIAFLYAPLFHPITHKVFPPENALGVKTIFYTNN